MKTLKAVECSRSIREIWEDFTAEYYVRFRTRISLNWLNNDFFLVPW